ncbi:uncharacterized protein LOC143072955 [Mytilus galloprovincialis]|uniref:uncharacterized protein LOC143072955 n=1 Tax=Mytilus galloprovincialis TaxID=29158 RepID=UPI003F7BE969
MLKVLSALCLSVVIFQFSETSSKHRVVTDTEGIKYDVTEIKEEGKEISVIRKNGVILEEQIVNQDKGYIVVKQNGTCSVEFHDEAEVGDCYTGTVPKADEVTEDIKQECGDLEIVFVRLGECPDKANGKIQARGWLWKPPKCSLCCYVKLVCSRWRCSFKTVCYWRCG